MGYCQLMAMVGYSFICCLCLLSILLFEALGVLWVLLYPASGPNHTSYRIFYLMNLLQMFCAITWAWSFSTSEVVEAARDQKHHILAHTLVLNVWFIPQCQFFLPKIHQEMRSDCQNWHTKSNAQFLAT